MTVIRHVRMHMAKILLFSFFAALIIAAGVLASRFGGAPPQDFAMPPVETMPEGSPGYNVDFAAFTRGEVCYEGFLPNLVKQDFPDFDAQNPPSDEHVLSFCIWEALTNPSCTDRLSLTGSGEITVPAQLVESIAERYFGPQVSPAHRTVSVHGLFSFSEDAQCYVAPIMGMEEHLLPLVMDVAAENGYTLLTVDYISALALEESSAAGGPAPSPIKSVLIRLEGGYREYRVASLTTLK